MPIILAYHMGRRYACAALHSENILETVRTLLGTWNGCGNLATERGDLIRLGEYYTDCKVSESPGRARREYNSLHEIAVSEAGTILLDIRDKWHIVIDGKIVEARFIVNNVKDAT